MLVVYYRRNADLADCDQLHRNFYQNLKVKKERYHPQLRRDHSDENIGMLLDLDGE